MIFPLLMLFMIFSWKAYHRERFFLGRSTKVFLVLILSLIVAFRPDDMPDYQNYLNLFEYEFDNKEAGYLFLIRVAKTIVNSEIFIFFVGAILSVGLKVYVIERFSPLIWLTLVAYISNLFILHDMIQLRCAIASSILLWAMYFLYTDRKKSAIICYLSAILFHYSAAAGILIFFINKNKINTRIYAIVLCVSYLLAILKIGFGYLWGLIPFGEYANLWEIYSAKQDSGEMDSINIYNAIFLFRFILSFVLLKNAEKLSVKCHYALPFIKLYCISIVLFLVLSDIPVLAFRLSELFQVVEFLLLPLLCFLFKGRRTGVMFVICVSMGFLLMNIFYNKLLL